MTTFLNRDGTAVIPTVVPPAIDAPATPPSTEKLAATMSAPDEPQLASNLPTVTEDRGPSVEAERPTLPQQFETERPRPMVRISTAPCLRRKGTNTNTSALNEAIWRKEHDSDSSSSSSSDDDEDSEAAAPPKRSGRAARGTGRTRSDTYGDKQYSRFNVGNENFKTKGKVGKKDGRLNISVNETNNTGYLAKALGASMLAHPRREDGNVYKAYEKQCSPHPERPGGQPRTLSRPVASRGSSESTQHKLPIPKLNIVVMVIGSRGDIQPFLRLGKILKEEYGHRVRIATHPAFRDFVEKDSGLEFFSVGGDPAELMAFMVKNPGMIPSMETVRTGEIGKRREQMAVMFQGFWRACINATDDEHDVDNLKMMGDKHPFVADAIIANPPCFAHIHCAERLGVPLHLMFTFPYTPTQAFPHPLANIKKTNVDPGYTNFMSYPLVEMMTWQGLGDLVNDFRVKTLGLEPVSTLWAPGQLYRLKVPYTYLWSPGLVPKPEDWGEEIDIAGFVFLDLASSFEPPKELEDFLKAGEPPVYIGFGSIVVDDPDKFTGMIFEAVKEVGVRALVSKGWGGLGGENTPDNIFMLENTPHDWLFPKVSAVVHHGGAGTTAIGLKCGKPTMVVPFFGDQMFWGSMIDRSGAGAEPVPYKNLTKEKLAAGIKHLLTDEAKKNAQQIAKEIEAEGEGAHNAVKSFHRSLTLRGEHSLRCSILEERVAVWHVKNTNLRLSALAADILVTKKKLSWKQLRLIRHCEWNDFEGPGEPITGTATAVMGTVTKMATGIGSVPFRLVKSGKKRRLHEERKKRKMKQASVTNGDAKASNSNAKVSKIRRSLTRSRKTTATKDFAEESPERNKESSLEGNKDSANGVQPVSSKDLRDSGADMSAHTTTGEPTHPERDLTPRNGEQEDNASSILLADPEEALPLEMAEEVGRGLGKTGEALVRAPMDLSLALAQGFHNAPRLYGDTTVRKPARITGIKSGFRAAGSEFVFGVYDAFSGVVIQPYTGARVNGAMGFLKGVGMGSTGFVLKNLSAVVGPLGYSLKGLQKQLLRGKQPTALMRKARIIQGQRDWKGAKDQAALKQQVMHGWDVVQQVWDCIQEQRKNGVKGRMKAMKERKTWKANGAFENVEMAEKALEARRRGESLEAVFREQREDFEKTKKPRKMVVDEMDGGNKKMFGEHGLRGEGEKPEGSAVQKLKQMPKGKLLGKDKGAAIDTPTVA